MWGLGLSKGFNTLSLDIRAVYGGYMGYIGMTEKKMETAIHALGFNVDRDLIIPSL